MNILAWKKLNAGILDLFSPGLNSTTYADRAFALLGELVSHDVGCFARHDPASGQLHIEHRGGGEDFSRGLEAFGRHMGQYPLFRFDPTVNDGLPFNRGDFFTRREFRQLDIHSEAFGPQGLMDHFAVHVPTADDSVVFFGLERGGSRDYSATDREILRLAQPHLTNAWKIAQTRTDDPPPTVEPGFFCRVGFKPRESEVLFWLTEGKSNLEIAHILGLSLPTVKGYVTAIFNALGVGNRLAATLSAIELIRKLGRTPHKTPATTVQASPGEC